MCRHGRMTGNDSVLSSAFKFSSSRSFMLRAITAFLLMAHTIAPVLAVPAQPDHSTDSRLCVWEWQTVAAYGRTVGAWTEDCNFGERWRLAPDASLPGFVLTIDGQASATVLHVLEKPADAPMSAVLPTLRADGVVPDDEDCMMKPAASTSLQTLGARPRTLAFFELMPVGARLAAFEATPEDAVPEPPCGDYGWSTHGLRLFQSDIRHPDLIIYMNFGEDGMQFEPRSVTVE
jgi:hypothetical protein